MIGGIRKTEDFVKRRFLYALAVACSLLLMDQSASSAATYTITTVAGNGSADFPQVDGGFATAAALVPKGVAVDPLGDIFVIDAGSATGQRPSTIRLVAAGLITTLACNGPDPLGVPPWGPILDVHQALCGNLTGVALDITGNLYISQGGGRTVDILTTGSGVVAINITDVNGPQNMAADSQGNVFVADSGNCRIVQTDRFGSSTVVAGGTCGFSGDNGPATNAALSFVTGVAVDGNGNLYIADTNNARVRKVDGTTRVITTVSGSGCTSYGAGDGGPAISASLCYPVAVAVDKSGNLFIAEYNSGLIRRVDTSGTITTIAGGVSNTTLGDGGLATNALLQFPYSLAVDSAGKIYVSDSGNFRVRLLTPVGPTLVTNVAVTSTGLLFSRVTRTFNGTVTITNTGQQAITGPVQLVLTNLTAGVTLANATGTTNGSPFITVPAVSSLGPGQSASVNLQFQDPSNRSIAFTPAVYSGTFF
jgi:sugar lactone lactonase YvrE